MSNNNNNNNSKKIFLSTKELCITALFTAIICVATLVIQIPIPLGYAHLGDCMILLAASILNPICGLFAAGIGSALADILSGYAIWAIPTLIIKSFMPLIAYILFKKKSFIFTFTGAVLSLLFMTLGYVVAGSIIYQSIALGITQTPGLLLKSLVNLVAFIALSKLPLKRIINIK